MATYLIVGAWNTQLDAERFNRVMTYLFSSPTIPVAFGVLLLATGIWAAMAFLLPVLESNWFTVGGAILGALFLATFFVGIALPERANITPIDYVWALIFGSGLILNRFLVPPLHPGGLLPKGMRPDQA